MSAEFTVAELRLMRSGLAQLHPTKEVTELSNKLLTEIDEKRATAHLIETGSYPQWARDRGVVR